MSLSNENKQAWCEIGRQAEVRFAGPLYSGVSILQNPAKAENKYAHDYLVLMPADIKTVRTKFYTAHRYGIPSETAITINKKDVDRYNQKYPHLVVIFDIDFEGFKSLRYAPMFLINKAISSGRSKLHEYKNRVGDEDGNARDSWVMDANWFTELL